MKHTHVKGSCFPALKLLQPSDLRPRCSAAQLGCQGAGMQLAIGPKLTQMEPPPFSTGNLTL